jgi:hypothetical protein
MIVETPKKVLLIRTLPMLKLIAQFNNLNLNKLKQYKRVVSIYLAQKN